MIHNLIQKFKIKITLKEIVTWFGFSFIGVFAVYISVFHRELNSMMFLEVFAYIDGYYQSHIDKHTIKRKK